MPGADLPTPSKIVASAGFRGRGRGIADVGIAELESAEGGLEQNLCINCILLRIKTDRWIARGNLGVSA